MDTTTTPAPDRTSQTGRARARQASKRAKRKARPEGAADAVPALLPELVIDLDADGAADLTARNWPPDLPAPTVSRAKGEEVDVAGLVAVAHAELGTFLRVTIRRAGGQVNTEILPPPTTAPEPPAGVAALGGFVPGEEVWFADAVTVEAADEDGRVEALPAGRLMLVIAPGSGRVVLIDPFAADGEPDTLVLHGEGAGQ